MLAEALGLVRGPPFADGCHWAEVEHLPETINSAIAAAATALAQLTLNPDPARAEQAARIGLDAHPTDEPLAILALRASARRNRLQVTWDFIVARWADHGIPISPELVAWHDRLLGGDDGSVGLD